MDRGAWQAALPRVAKGWTLLSDFHFTLPFGEGWASSFFSLLSFTLTNIL